MDSIEIRIMWEDIDSTLVCTVHTMREADSMLREQAKRYSGNPKAIALVAFGTVDSVLVHKVTRIH